MIGMWRVFVARISGSRHTHSSSLRVLVARLFVLFTCDVKPIQKKKKKNP